MTNRTTPGTGATNTAAEATAAFFIDADNLSADAVEQAFARLKNAGIRVTVRRAHGGLEALSGMKAVLRRHAVHAVVNQGKGSTDVALAVDAMDFLHRGGLPAIVVMGSSDADFAPLAVRLREAGLRLMCCAQKGKAANSLPRAYDDIFFLDDALAVVPSAAVPFEGDSVPVSPAKQLASPQAAPALKKPAAKTLPGEKAIAIAAASTASTLPASKAPIPAAKAATKKPASSKTAAKKTAAEKAASASSGGAKPGVSAADILAAAPILKSGQAQPLGEVVKLLHDAKVLAKSAGSTKLFKKFPGQFEVSLKSPHQVRYVAAKP